MAKRYQVAAVPVRQDASLGTQVLLVTSRETRRWVVPKGWPWPKHADHDAAAAEAWEEAGVVGRVKTKSIGSYTYDKRRDGRLYLLKVNVYVLAVTKVAETWPEFNERDRQWFTAREAASLVDEPALKDILLSLAA